MKYYSTNRKAPLVSFRESLLQGLAPDKGLYHPETIPTLPDSFFATLPGKSLVEIGVEVGGAFVGNDIPEGDLLTLLEDVFQFDIPLVQVEEDIHSLELWHGPTLSFKDVGARFMARCVGYLNRDENQKVTVLVATSGDTGSAVANGFLGVEGVEVVILYPSGKVSQIQEQQLTTLGQNITALEVKGTFDDCQAMVKGAFVDPDLQQKLRLTSANSISLGRLIPQSFYYFYTLSQLGHRDRPVVICVPSGNFGNLTAGLIGKKMGLPVHRYVAATNVNDPVPEYLRTGVYRPRPSQPTVSNAMDVGAPSNFARMLEIYGHSPEKMREDISGYSFSDSATLENLEAVYKKTGYLMDPHGSVGNLGLLAEIQDSGAIGVFLETAHPAKFIDVIEGNLGISVQIPERLRSCLDKKKEATLVGNDLKDLKEFLMYR